MSNKTYTHNALITKYFFKYFLLILYYLFNVLAANAQQFNNWIFPDSNGLTFNTSPLSLLAGSQNTVLNGNQSAASISDKNGTLLFYSDGEKVWNRNNLQMPNGFNLFGADGQINTALIIPFVNDKNKYYLFTSKGLSNFFPNSESTLPYCYSIIDMQLNGGLGDVTVKNNLIQFFSTEKMVAIPHENGNDIWWVCRDWTNHFYSYKITCNGFQNTTPVLSSVGKNVNSDFSLINGGDIKGSNDGKFIAACYPLYFEIYKFSNSTGNISFPITISIPEGCYGVEFSPNNKLLYITGQELKNNLINTFIKQFDLSNYDSSSIVNSAYRVNNVHGFGGLQLGPDGKIYSNDGGNAVAVINYPNVQGVGCGYQDSVIVLPNGGYRRFPYSYSNLITNQNVQITSSVAADCRTATLTAKTYIKGNTLSFKWKFGDGDSAIQNVTSGGDTTYTTIVHTYPLISGVDTFFASLTVTSDTVCGQGRAGAKVVVKPPKPTAKFSFAPIACGQQQVQFIDSSLLNSNPSISYQWAYKAANSAGAFTNFSTQQNPLFNFATLDSFKVRLIVSSALACVVADTIVKTIYLKAKPIAAFTASNACGSLLARFNNTSTVAADTLQSYHWRFGNSQNSTDKNPAFTFATYGTKTVQLTVTSSRGCTSDTVTQSIVIKAKPTIGSGITADSICANTPFALSASALVDSATISNYQWQLNGNPIGTNSSFLNQNSSTAVRNRYTLLATSSQGCISDTAVILIAIVGKPTATFTTINNCGSKSVAFNTTASVINDAINTYWWSFGDGTTSLVQNPTKTFTNFSSGYTVQLVATSSKGCRSDTTTLTIPVKDKPAAALQYNGDACANTNFTVTANTTLAAATINTLQWWVNDVAVSNNNAQLLLNKPAGNYRIKFLATSSQGCNSDTVRLPIIVDATPTAAFSTTNSCTATNIVINNNSVGNISRYKWLWGNGDSSLLPNPAYAYTAAGTFNITLQTITANGCVATSRQPITILNKPTAAFTITESCLGKPLTIVNNSTGNDLTYSWTTSDAKNFLGNTPSIVFNTIGNYSVQLQVSNSLGCSSSSSKNFTIVKVQITASNDTAIVINQPLQLNASGANSYSWLPTSVLTNANSPRPIFRVNSPGVFPLLVKGTTSQGCLGTDTVMVTVYKTPIGLLLPNAFSPNGDGRNDVLNLNCAGLQLLTYFNIVNRYGQTIFEQRNCRSLGWDGTYKGTKQNPGTYVYYWEGIDFTGKKVNGKGTVVLVR